MKIKISETKEVETTPEILAKIFWEMNNEQQAEFFDCLAKISNGELSEQMEYVAHYTESLTSKALHAMENIGRSARERLFED